MAISSIEAFAEEASGSIADVDTAAPVGKGKEHTGRFGYWRKAEVYGDGSPCPDAGYIVTGPVWPMERLRQMDKGMQYLRAYGTFDLQEGGIDSNMEKFRRILTNGGAKEFPIKQIIELGWHRPQGLPRYARRAKFPQLKGVEIHDVTCKVCHRVFSSLEDAQALLTKHERIAHREISREAGMIRAFGEAQGQAAGPLGDLLGIVKQQIEQQGINNAATAEAMKQLAAAVTETTKQSNRRAS
jgi:hypothetical protein